MLERLFTKEFWNRALSRVIRTVVQGFIAATASCTLIGEVDWALIGSTSLLAALTSLAMSILWALPEEDAEKEHIQG
ncbi:holin [Allobaculum stercoricanis]|uniref:holin n=1 Tax=Allobaculum stercoricanis TaxID=174709 RepID=UPI0029422578|nr:holin [Allobaculum stercoricanis]